MHRSQWITILCTVALLAPPVAGLAHAQESAPPPPPSVPALPSPEAPSSKPGKAKYSHVNDFLIRGTVFDDKALSFPGVQLRIRRAGEKKFRWESYTNSRGEFAVRVPQGSAYEMVVRAKGFGEQTRTIEAKSGGNEQSIVFQMQPASGGKG
jgi:Carboxypeptidase regulatory-like domain